MPSRFRTVLLLAFVAIALVSGALPARAAEVASSDVVLIREGVIVADDLIATGLSVRISGEIHGDLVVFAAEEVFIDGRVTGSVTAAAGSVVVTGTVEGSVRVAANRVTVRGTIGKDLVATALTTILEPGSLVSGEVLVWGFRMDSLGTVEGDLTGTQRMLNLAGRIGGDAVVSVSRLVIVEALMVSGNLSYRSARDAEGLELATVDGAITHRTPLPPNIRVRALAIFARGMVALFLTIAAVTFIWGWPERSRAAIDQVAIKPWKNWLLGAAIFLSPVLIIAATAAMLALAPPAAGLPLLAVVVPLTLALFGVLLAVGLIAGAPVAARFGSVVFRRVGIQGAVLGGSLLIGLIWMLPVVGFVVPLLVLPLGLGSWVLSRSGAAGAEEAPA